MSDTQVVDTPPPSAPEAPPVAPNPDALPERAGLTDEQWLDRFEPPAPSDIVEPPSEAAPVEGQTAQPQEDSPAANSQDAGGAQPETKADYETARNALRRDGITTAVLEKMTQAEVLDLGLRRAKNHADVDAAYKDLKDLRAKQDSPAKPAEAPTTSAQAVDLAAAIAPFAEILGEDATPHLEAFGKALLAQQSKELDGVRQALQSGQAAVLEIALDRGREKLAGRFPQLQDDAKFDIVKQKMQQLAPAGTHDSMIGLMGDAAAIVFFDEIKQTSTAERSQAARSKVSGQPTTQSSAQPARAMTPDQQADYALDQLEKGTAWKTVQKHLAG